MSLYQHGRKTKRQKSANTFLATLIIAGVVVLVAWWIVHKDIGSGSEAKTTVPIVTEVGAEKEAMLDINEPFFSFQLPADWKLLERKTGNGINAYIYKSTKKGGDDRMLYVHVDVMPRSYKITRLQPITPNGNKFTLGNLSDNCINFAGEVNRTSNAPFPAKWENISFICDPITTNQTIGTGTEGTGIETRMGRHAYFFYWEDHNIRPDDKILRDALSSFRAK